MSDATNKTPTNQDAPHAMTARDAMVAFEASNPYVEPHFWPFGIDFGSDLEAALHWAQCGFEVYPAGWSNISFLTRPEDIVVAWSGQHFRDPVMGRAPRGVFGIVSRPEDGVLAQNRDGDPHVAGMDFYGQGPQLTWDDRAPGHWWQPDWSAPGSQQTFTVRLPWNRSVVRLWTVPEGFQFPEHPAAHRFPEASVLTTKFQRVPFPLPCRSSEVTATGMIQPAPAHVLRLADFTPLPCREQDAKGNPCDECARYNNVRTVDELGAIRDEYMRSFQ